MLDSVPSGRSVSAYNSVKVLRVPLGLYQAHSSGGTASQVILFVDRLLIVLLGQALGGLVAELEGTETKVELGVWIVEGPCAVHGVALVAYDER